MMTREEAIKTFEDILQLSPTLDETGCSVTEAMKVALSALRPVSREQVEKVLRGEWGRYCFSEQDGRNDMPTLTPPNEWVSVEERLPEYNPGTGAKSYWVAKKDNAGNWQMKIAQYCDYGYAMTMDAETEVTWRDWDFTKIVNVTHWMPLPAPPAKEDQK